MFFYDLLNGTLNSTDCIVCMFEFLSQPNSCLLLKELCIVYLSFSLWFAQILCTGHCENIVFYRTFLCCRVIPKEKTGAE